VTPAGHQGDRFGRVVRPDRESGAGLLEGDGVRRQEGRRSVLVVTVLVGWTRTLAERVRL